jgi:hypothetical protein
MTMVVLAVLLIAAAGAGYGVSTRFGATVPPTPISVTPAPAAPSLAPSFDIVRVAPDGGVVLAGRAAPGAAVTVQQAGRTVGEARADASGSWVMTPTAKLPPGAGELTLSARAPDAPRRCRQRMC